MRILLADDHALLRDTVKAYIEQSDIEAEVDGVGSLPEATALLDRQRSYDLILLDIDMPGMNGVGGMSLVKQRAPKSSVVILSALATPENILAALDHGADGFIPKMMHAKAMLMALRLIMAGERYVPANMLEDVRHLKEQRSQKKPTEIAFSPEEAMVLGLLKEGLANKEIGRRIGMEEHTVKYFVRSIFKKIGAKNRTQAVSIALKSAESDRPPVG